MANYIKFPFTVREAHNTHVLNTMCKVADIFREESLSTFGRKHDTDVLILEDFGQTLRQLDWSDESGWYVTYRLHPLYSKNPKTQEAAQRAEKKFINLFDPKSTSREVNPEFRVTLAVTTSRYSIGD